MTTITSGHRFEISHKSGTPEDPGLCSADDIAAYMLIDSVAISTATSRAVSTVSAAAPDSANLSIADSKAVSSGTRAGVADSKAVSGSVNTSVADSKAISVSGSCSIADSKAVSVQNSVPILTVVANSQNVSTADSKGVSSGTRASTADSKAVSDSGTTSTADSKAVSIATATALPARLPAGGRTTTTITDYLANNAAFTPRDFSATGDGVTDDTTTLAATLTAANASVIPADVILPPAKDFLVTSVTNTPGARFVGSGRVLKAITGGSQQLNSYGDLYQHVFGREYLAAYTNRILTSVVGANVVLTGDSTTSGTGVTGNYVPDVLLKLLSQARGVTSQFMYNRGQSGKHSGDWQTTYVAGDILNGGNTPHLIIVRWGINDPFYSRTVAQFIASMRASLLAIRTTLSVTACSILLMSPSATSDSPNGRDERWNEEISLALRQMAREYSCCFYDTYARFRDARTLAGSAWDDIGTGQAIHPANQMNALIYSDVADLLYPVGLSPVLTNRFQNLAAVDATKTTATLDSAFDKGITLFRADKGADTAWPLDGAGMVVRHADAAYALELNWAYTGGGDSGIALRIGQSGTWLGWLRLYGNKIVPSNATAFALRNQADSADNISITDAGRVTIREKLLLGTSPGTTGGVNIDASSFGNVGIHIVNSTNAIGMRASSTLAQVGTYAAVRLDLMANSITKLSVLSESAGTASLQFDELVSRIVGGGTSLALRNNANAADNLLITDAGVATFRSTVITVASATAAAGLRLPHGAAPTSPTDGDTWTTSSGFFIRINGVTKTVTLT